MRLAYKRGDGRKIDGRRVIVDVERGRTVRNWKVSIYSLLSTMRSYKEDCQAFVFGGCSRVDRHCAVGFVQLSGENSP